MKTNTTMVYDNAIDYAIDKELDNMENNTVMYIVYTDSTYGEFYKFDMLNDAMAFMHKNNMDNSLLYVYDESKVSNALQDDSFFEHINSAEYDRFDLNSRIARNAKKRLDYWLKKANITIQDWDLWCTL